MFALIHFLHVRLFEPEDTKFMTAYKSQKFRMKLAYEAWIRDIEVVSLIFFGILKTLK